jgi:riboflavin kinase/FMN adenylyltransferase
MHIFNSLESLKELFGEADFYMALGNFDGVHLGHQKLIEGVVSSARNRRQVSVVVTFDPHPSQYFAKVGDFKKIDSPSIRRHFLARLHVDAMLELKFDKTLAETSARDFLDGITSAASVRQISVGTDFRFGRGRQGDANFLREFCAEKSIECTIVEPVHVDGIVASSSQVRLWLRDGRVDLANKMLGRPFALTGTVVEGNKVGRSIGFPTANLDHMDQLVPGTGVYAGFLTVKSDISAELRGVDQMRAVVNVGVRPTLNLQGKGVTVEAHVYDRTQGDLDFYGQTVELTFCARLRDEKKFQDVTDLRDQIQRDVDMAKSKSNLC